MITVVYTPTYQVILSRRCAFACDYCNFPHTPSPVPPSPKQFRSFLRNAQRMGAWQVTLTAGEGIDTLPEVQSTMRYYGFHNWHDYLVELCKLTLEARGRQPLSPVLDVGALSTRHLRQLAPYLPKMRLLLDTLDTELSARVHAQAPQKNPILRLLAVKDVARAGIPLATGIRVGMGESSQSWIDAAKAINEIHDEFGNVTGFHLVPFVPQPFSPMQQNLPASNEVFKEAIGAVRRVLRKDIPIVAEVYHRFALAPEAVISGAFDLGAIRIATNERFDLDMLNAVNSVADLLARINVSMKTVPVLREFYIQQHRLPDLVLQNWKRFQEIGRSAGEDTPSHGNAVFGPA